MQSSLAHIASADAVHPAIPSRSKKTRTIPPARARRRGGFAHGEFPRQRRRLQVSVSLGHGAGNSSVWISGTMDFVSSGAEVRSRTVGLSCDAGDLVGQFAPRLHVF